MNDYYESAKKAADMTDQGQYPEALALYMSIISSNISDIDKSVMCMNAAVVNDKMGKENEALKMYDKGIKYEKKHKRFFVLEKKAAYLVTKGRYKESYKEYKKILRNTALTNSDRSRITINLNKLESYI